MGILDAPVNIQSAMRYVPVMPGSLGWDTTNFPFSITSITDLPGTLRSTAVVSVTPEGLFDAVSTARTAPGATFYVDVSTGNDANPGTIGSKVKSIWKAIALANAAAVPTKIIVTGSTYFRTNNPWFNGGSGIQPTVDLALIADAGRVITGTFDPPGTLSRDGTQVNCFVLTVSSVNRVCDMANLDRFGNYTDLKNVATAALCNAEPNSWTLVAGTLYIHRADQAGVTNANTRVFRPSTKTTQFLNPVNVYMGGTSPGDGWDLEGGSNNAAFDASPTSPGSTRHVIAVKDSTFRYGGGTTDTGARAVAVDSWQGLAAFFNCRADGGWTDGFNFHNSNAASNMNVLTVNCSGYDNGRPGGVSCNGWTSHEDVKGIDVAGFYWGNHGGTVRSINTSKTWLAGTAIKDDYGDLFSASGSLPPTAVMVDDTATYWCDRVRLDMPAGGRGYRANTAGSAIHKHNCWPTPLPDSGPGTIDTY